MTKNRQHDNGEMAGAFLARIAAALDQTAEPGLEIDRTPREHDAIMVKEIDMACDPLHDATAERRDVTMFGIPRLGQHTVFTFDDDTAVTALTWWGEDHIDLLEGRHEQPDWLAEKPDAIMIVANNPAHLRAFENVCRGSNAPTAWREPYDPEGEQYAATNAA